MTKEIRSKLIAYVLKTRRYGYCYVHSEIRNGCTNRTIDAGNGMTFQIGSYGRSVYSGGNKYKVRVIGSDGRPVKSTILTKLAA